MATLRSLPSPPPPPPLPPLPIHPSPPPLLQVPFNLPPPLYRSDPVRWSRLNHHLWSTCGLLHHERAILGAVFQHIPIPTASVSLSSPSLIDRILTLSVEHLRLLARLFNVALLHARSWGGPRRSTASNTPASNASFSVSSSLRGSPATPEAEPTTFAIYESLFTALDIPTLPAIRPPSPTTTPALSSSSTPVGTAPARSAKQKANCLRRHLDTCPITLKTSTIEHAHIIPHSVVALSNQAISPFWMMLGVVLGPVLRDTVFQILGPANGYSTTNSLALDTSLHKLIDKGTLHLAPIARPDATFAAATCQHYDVRFTWWGSAAELSVCLTTVHREPIAQVRPATNGLQHVRGGPPRVIDDGDHFRLFTNDPAKLPLPHPLLLDLHGMLWRMLSTASMAEAAGVRKRRLNNGDDDADDDDNADSRRNSARGTPRTSTPQKRRKKDSMPPPPPPPPPPPMQRPMTGAAHGAPDSFDLKWVDFRLGVLAAERQESGGEWEAGGAVSYSSDCAESGWGSDGSDEERRVVGC